MHREDRSLEEGNVEHLDELCCWYGFGDTLTVLCLQKLKLKVWTAKFSILCKNVHSFKYY